MTLSRETTEEEVDYTVETVKNAIARLRDMSPLYEDFVNEQKKKGQ
jgi:cysteine desulfurase